MFYDGAGELIRVLVVGTAAYLGLLAALRVSGKRTLSQMNAFDLVVTVALGSTLATVLLSEDVSLSGGLLALGLLVTLQFAIAWLSVRLPASERFFKAEPSLLLFRGQLLADALKRERVTPTEVDSALRGSGLASRDDAYAVVLETNGHISVIASGERDGDNAALRGVRGYDGDG